ncbi:Kinesin-like protein KIN-13A [Asimina triloba]
MGGQMHQSNAAAAAALYDAGPTSSDAGDAVMARWLQSAGLQHLASPLASSGIDHRLLPNLLMQGSGAQSAEEKQKLFKLLRNLNFNGESASEPYTPTAQSSSATGVVDGFYSPELRGEFGAGLLDLHAMDDTELLSEHVMSEPFEPSPFMPAVTRGFDDDFDTITTSRPQKAQADAAVRLSTSEKEPAPPAPPASKESNLAKIKVVVRKRPLNKKELSRKEDDIVTVYDNAYLTVHEPKLKVDLTAYVEKHEFCFDAVLNEHVTNDEVYRVTVEPIIPTIFQRTKATCFAYGQTGSGKTYTMQPLPLKAAEDIVRLLHQPYYRSQRFKLWLSYFEIYGGKLFDLLSDRRKLCMREDGRQQVCIVGLQEFEVSDVQIVKEFIERGNAARSTGSTGANEESSRSHAILQLVIKKHSEVKETKRHNEANETRAGKVIGKISFIDLAGSERGADTTDNDRQTRIEGAEINKSLLALKECIRALDNDQIHIPFRGSKLTEVLRDSFVGSCEHTLNTLRYADRVKSLSKSGNTKKDPVSGPTAGKDSSSATSLPVSTETEDPTDQNQEMKVADPSRRAIENSAYNSSADFDRNSSSFPANYSFNGKEESGATSVSLDRDRVDVKNCFGGSTSNKSFSSAQNSFDAAEDDKVQKVSPPRRKLSREEKVEKPNNWTKKDTGHEPSTTSYKQQPMADFNLNSVAPKRYEPEPSPSHDGEINAILEEEEALISAHRKEIEETMEIVREEMKLLAEVDQPGSLIDNYVTQLSFVLSRKAAGLVSLQARLARFQHRLKEQEILSRKKVPHVHVISLFSWDGGVTCKERRREIWGGMGTQNLKMGPTGCWLVANVGATTSHRLSLSFASSSPQFARLKPRPNPLLLSKGVSYALQAYTLCNARCCRYSDVVRDGDAVDLLDLGGPLEDAACSVVVAMPVVRFSAIVICCHVLDRFGIFSSVKIDGMLY